MKKIIKSILLILWLILIFYMSSQTGGESGGLSEALLRLVGNFLNNFISIDMTWFINTFNILIRKLAHMSEYFILYILATTTFKEYKLNKYYLTSLIFTIVYAISDEIHQVFIDGRCGCASDVLIDSLGALIAFFFWHLINSRGRNIT